MSSSLSPCSLSLCSSSCTQEEQVSCCPAHRTTLWSAAYWALLLRNYLPKASPSQIMSLKMAGLSVLINQERGLLLPGHSGYDLWKSWVSTRGSPQTNKTSQQLLFSCCWGWWCKGQQCNTRTLGWWDGLAIYCPRKKYGFKPRLSNGWPMWGWSKYLLLSVSVPRWNQRSRSLCKSP